MGVSGGPNITEEGVVFYYDTGNDKSYAGEPTTNVVANPLPTAGWSVAAGTQGSALTRTYLEEDGKPFMRFSGVTNGQDYPRVTNSAFANSATITGTFSTSLEVRGTPGAVLRFRIYENGSTKITNTITLTSEWTRYTFDNQTTGFNLNQPYFNPATSNAIYDIRNIQVEAKAHSTPFVNGTRSATEGLEDLTGNSTLNLSYASFNNNAQISFDGTGTNNNIYIEGGTPEHLKLYGDHTLEAVINPDSAAFVDGSAAVLRVGMNADILYSMFLSYGLNAISYQYYKDSFRSVTSNGSVITRDEYNHVVVVKSGLTVTFYINGVEQGGGNILQSTVDPILIGIGAARSGAYTGTNAQDFAGEIDMVKIYNRALTAEEVQNNFNGIRNRFGI